MLLAVLRISMPCVQLAIFCNIHKSYIMIWKVSEKEKKYFKRKECQIWLELNIDIHCISVICLWTKTPAWKVNISVISRFSNVLNICISKYMFSTTNVMCTLRDLFVFSSHGLTAIISEIDLIEHKYS